VKPTGPRSIRTALRTANVATFLFSTAGAFFLLLPVYLHQRGSSPAQIGLVAGLLRASSLVARPMGGYLLDRFGRRPVALAGAGLAIVGVLSLFVFPDLGVPFLAMRILQGIGTSLVDSGLGTLVADLSPPAARLQIFAIYTAWMNLASALMPGVGEAIARRAGFPSLFGAAALALVGGLSVMRWLPETAPPRHEPAKPVPGLARGAAPLLLGSVVVGLAYGVLSVFVPVAPIAAAPGRAGMYFFAYFLGLIGARLAGGLGLVRLAGPGVLLPAYALLAAGLAALPLGGSALLLLGVGIVCGVSHGVLMPVIYALLLVGVSRDRRGRAVALLAAAFDLGNILAALGLGLAAESLGYPSIFLLAAGVVILGAAVSHVWGRR